MILGCITERTNQELNARDIALHGAYYVDILAAFKEWEKRDYQLLSRDNFHPNTLGYRLMAVSVYNACIKEHLIPEQKKIAFATQESEK